MPSHGIVSWDSLIIRKIDRHFVCLCNSKDYFGDIPRKAGYFSLVYDEACGPYAKFICIV